VEDQATDRPRCVALERDRRVHRAEEPLDRHGLLPPGTTGRRPGVALDLAGKSGVIVLANASQMRIDQLGVQLLQTLRGDAVTPLVLPQPITLPRG
jgi:hypothetical protein